MDYFKNSINVEWLSNEPWGDEAEDLALLHYAITDGGSIGRITRTVTNQELTRDEAVETDISYGGDGTFIVAGDEEYESGDEDESGE